VTNWDASTCVLGIIEKLSMEGGARTWNGDVWSLVAKVLDY